MQPPEDEVLCKRIAELQRMIDQQDQTEQSGEPAQETERPFTHSDAHAAAKQLGEYLRKLHAEDQQSHTNNNTWLVQIDKQIKDLDMNQLFLALLVITMPFIARSCGG